MKKINNAENGVADGENKCVDYSCLRIKVVDQKGSCPKGMSSGDTFKLDNLVPQGMCLAAFHSAIPYYITLANGGHFGWLKDRNAVVFQCPNPEAAVAMKLSIQKAKDNQLLIEVIKTRGTCPQEMSPFKMFTLSKDNNLFCPKAIDALFPYVNILNAVEQNPCNKASAALKVACPGYPDYLIFEISYRKKSNQMPAIYK